MSERESLILSVVVVNWNTRDLLRRCLDSVYATVPPLQFELIVVDNASEDGSADMVAECYPGATLIRSSSNLGFAAGSNLGLNGASGHYLMLLNPDVELLEGTAQTMIDFMSAHQEVGVLGPKLINSDGTLQKNGRRFPGLLREVLEMTRLYRLAWRAYDRRMQWGREDFDHAAEVDEVCGACILARKSAVDSVGLLDERFFMYYEDVDWCLRMKEAGWRIFYLPSARVVHHWARGVRRLSLLDADRMLYRSQYLYFLKHHGPVHAWILRVLSMLLLAALGVKRALFGPRRMRMENDV